MVVRTCCIVVVIFMLSLFLFACGTSGGGSDGGSISAKGVVLKQDVAVVDRPSKPVVKSMDDDGGGYTLDGSAPGVDKLVVGQVMLVKREAVGRVRELYRDGKDVHVRVDGVGPSDVIRDGELRWENLKPNPAQMRFLASDDPGGVTDNSTNARRNKEQGRGSLGGDSGAVPVRPYGEGGWSGKTIQPGQQTQDSVKVRVGRFNIEGRYTPFPNGFTTVIEIIGAESGAEYGVQFKVTLKDLNSTGYLSVVNGQTKFGNVTFAYTGSAEVSMHGVKTTPGTLADNWIVNIPMEWYFPTPLTAAGIPAVAAFKFKALIAPALTTNGANLNFNVKTTFGAAGSPNVTNGNPGGSGSFQGEDHSTHDDFRGVSPGPSGFAAAIRPRIGWGLGLASGTSSNLNALIFTDLVVAAGGTIGGALGIAPACRSYNVVETGRVGFESRVLATSAEFVQPVGEYKYNDYWPKVPACKPN